MHYTIEFANGTYFSSQNHQFLKEVHNSQALTVTTKKDLNKSFILVFMGGLQKLIGGLENCEVGG